MTLGIYRASATANSPSGVALLSLMEEAMSKPKPTTYKFPNGSEIDVGDCPVDFDELLYFMQKKEGMRGEPNPYAGFDELPDDLFLELPTRMTMVDEDAIWDGKEWLTPRQFMERYDTAPPKSFMSDETRTRLYNELLAKYEARRS